MRKALLTIGVVSVLAVTAIFAGPVASGGLLLLLPATATGDPQPLAEDYRPLHDGDVDLSTGLYIRTNEDLFVPGAPALILQRTYLSRDRVARAFGIGTTHPGEEYLIGDGERFQWASLILATGTRINFRRTSSGTSLLNAMFVHDESATEWEGAELGWTGVSWAIRKSDGSLSIYQGCGVSSVCSIIKSRDAAGQSIFYQRDSNGTLQRMHDGKGRSITFEHDSTGRIIRATTSTSREARYDYDARGRLAAVTVNDGIVRRYTYTDLDELTTIEEPGTSIENIYESGRCIRQINRYPDREPFVFVLTYHLEHDKVVRTAIKGSDGVSTEYKWDAHGASVEETNSRPGFESSTSAYERAPRTGRVTSVTVTCPDRQGLPLPHTSIVRGGNEEWVEQNLLSTHCHWNRWRLADRKAR